MNISNDLFQLVGSMTKQEKRYFKLHASFYSKEEGNSALKLYEIIDKGKAEDDATLASAVQHESFARYLPIVKKHLTEQILNSLTAYHTDKKATLDLRKILSHVEILFDKGLYNHCRKILARAEKKAMQTEKHLFMMEITYWKRLLLLRNVSSSFETDIHDLYKQANHTMEVILSTNRYLELMDVTQAITVRYASHPHPADLRKLQEIADNPLLQDESMALSFDAKIAFRNIRGTYMLLTGSNEQALYHYREAVRVWKEHPAMIAERPAQYRRYLINYLNSLASTRNDEEFAEIITSVKALSDSGTGFRINRLREVWNIELFYYLNNGRLDRGGTVIDEIRSNIRQHRSDIQPSALIPLYYNCSVFYFLEGNHRMSLDYINTIMNETSIELKRDIQEFTRIFSLITHYELRNFDILDNMIRATQRFLRQKETLSDFETLVLRAIRSLLGSVNEQTSLAVFRSLHTDLVTILHAPDANPLGLLEVLFWTESKLRQRSIRDVFTEKMQTGGFTDHRDIFPAGQAPAAPDSPSTPSGAA